MKIKDCIQCERFPCLDVSHDGYIIPEIELDTSRVSIVLISEAASKNPQDYYYMPGNPLYQQTTLLAFQDAGAQVQSFQDILDLGVYLTSALKCAKLGYGVKAGTIEQCSLILEQELALFPEVKAYLLMGDVAIKAFNFIARRAGEKRVIPPGSTYKLRGEKVYFHGARAFPSYLQAGPSFFIEKSKRRMIAQDISEALVLVN